MTPAWLRCPRCRSTLAPDDAGWHCDGCGAAVPRVDGYIDALQALDDVTGVELDFTWDWRSDPSVTPMTVERWKEMTRRVAAKIAGVRARPFVVGVGGGGEHWLADELAGRVGTYVVVDPSPDQLWRAREPAGADLTTVRGIAEHLPVSDATADVVEMQGVLDHVVDPALALGEAARVLRPGGRLVVAQTNVDAWYKRVAARVGRAHDDEHEHAAGVDQLERLLAVAGLQVEAVETVGFVRLPRLAERAVGRARLAASAVRASDLVGRRIAPRAGGIMIVTARTPD